MVSFIRAGATDAVIRILRFSLTKIVNIVGGKLRRRAADPDEQGHDLQGPQLGPLAKADLILRCESPSYAYALSSPHRLHGISVLPMRTRAYHLKPCCHQETS